eukprot:2128279-Pyramimonas_sp.AAC.1
MMDALHDREQEHSTLFWITRTLGTHVYSTASSYSMYRDNGTSKVALVFKLSYAISLCVSTISTI